MLLRNKLKTMLNRKASWMAIAVVTLTVVACGDDKEAVLKAKKAEAVKTYADIVHANYQDALTSAKSLQGAIKEMTEEPNEASFQAAKDAWLAAREPYGQSEAFRLYGGPIDDEDGPEGRMNAWPMDESYVDYTNGATNGDDPTLNIGTNIINSPDAFPTISATVLAGLNEAGGETNVSTGWHAIEFLLWGQDVSPEAGGGERTYADYVVNGDVANAERRATYLNAVADLLVSDLQSLVDEWAPESAFRINFTSEAQIDASLEKLLNGIGKLSKGELAGERMFVAWDLQSKEDEHSCFSDNTHRDIVANAQGIKNVYEGKYVRLDGSVVEGVGMDEVAELVNPSLNSELKSLLDKSLMAVEAIRAPFDQEILGADTAPGRIRVKAGFVALREQGDKLAELASALGYTLDPNDI